MKIEAETQKEIQSVMIRWQPSSDEQMERDIIHCLRSVKSIKSVTDKNAVNYFYDFDDKKIIGYSTKKPLDKKYRKKYVESMADNVEEHRKLLRKFKKQSLNRKRQQSHAIGVIGFSDSMKNKWNNIFDKSQKTKFFKKAVESLNDITNEFGIEFSNLTFHTDERGQPHFHFHARNFKSDGSAPRFDNSKELGGRLQDIVAGHFDEFGFNRGEENSKKKHLTVKEYQEHEDKLKEIESERIELQKNNEELKKEVADLKQGKIDALKQLDIICNQLIELNLADDAGDFLERFNRIKSDKRIESLINKAQRFLDTNTPNDSNGIDDTVKTSNNTVKTSTINNKQP